MRPRPSGAFPSSGCHAGCGRHTLSNHARSIAIPREQHNGVALITGARLGSTKPLFTRAPPTGAGPAAPRALTCRPARPRAAVAGAGQAAQDGVGKRRRDALGGRPREGWPRRKEAKGLQPLRGQDVAVALRDLSPWHDRSLIDATNQFIGPGELEEELNGRVSSVIVADHALVRGLSKH